MPLHPTAAVHPSAKISGSADIGPFCTVGEHVTIGANTRLVSHVVITGHTHQVVNETKSNTLFLNPGECCGWVNDLCTVAILDLDTLKAEIVQVHE